MNTVKTLQINSTSSGETMGIGERFGKKCRGGEVFLLASDLGGGKTTFTKGLAKGLGSEDVVSSPTFTVSREYNCRDGVTIHHFDFYRLQEGGMVAYELAEFLNDPRAVIVIEWGDVVSEALPEERVTIHIERSKEGEGVRSITVKYPENLAYVVEQDA